MEGTTPWQFSVLPATAVKQVSETRQKSENVSTSSERNSTGERAQLQGGES